MVSWNSRNKVGDEVEIVEKDEYARSWFTAVPNGAAGHYLLGLIYRYSDRRKSAVDHFKQALSIDPLLWAAYEELCILGAAEEAEEVFGEADALCIHPQYANQNLQTVNDDHGVLSCKTISLEDSSARQLRHSHGNNLREIPYNHHGAVTGGVAAGQPLNGSSSSVSLYSTPSPMISQLSAAAPPPLFRNGQQNPNTLGGESSPRSVVNSTIQAPRRKFVDEGKLRKGVRARKMKAKSLDEGLVLTAKEAWNWGRMVAYRPMELESNCGRLVKLMEGSQSNLAWQAQSVWDDYKELYWATNGPTNFLIFKHVHKEGNPPAIGLIHKIKTKGDCSMSGHPPSSIFSLLFKDKSVSLLGQNTIMRPAGNDEV